MIFKPFMVETKLQSTTVALDKRLSYPKRIKQSKLAEMDILSKPKRQFTELSHRTIGCAIEVHRALGPGLLESAYQQCLAHELQLNDIAFQIEHPLPIDYKGVRLDCGYRLDLLVDNEIILELKSVEQLQPIHEAQLLSYLKLSGLKQGFLINFNVSKLKDGLKSMVL